MNINALLLCNYAEVKDDRLHVSDGGWDRLTALAWPASHEIHVAVLLAPSLSDIGKDLDAVVRVLTPAGTECARTEAAIRLPAMHQQVPVVLPAFPELEQAGEYRVAVTIANSKAQVSFELDGPPADVRVQPELT